VDRKKTNNMTAITLLQYNLRKLQIRQRRLDMLDQRDTARPISPRPQPAAAAAAARANRRRRLAGILQLQLDLAAAAEEAATGISLRPGTNRTIQTPCLLQATPPTLCATSAGACAS
jgi:hypothetical protein